MPRLMISDKQWEFLEEKLIQAGAYLTTNLRVIVEGIFYRLRVGCPWRDLPQEFGPYSSIYNQFNRWSKRGIIAEVKEVDYKVYEVIAFTVHTGLRRGEVEGLLRDVLDFERREITVKRSFCHKTHCLNGYTKGKSIRRVPMNKLVFEILHSREEWDKEARVFEFDFVHFTARKFRPMQRDAEVPEIKFHDLRHTFASHLAMSGVSLFDVQKLLGHTEIKTTMRYMHLAPGHLDGKTDVLV